MGNQGLQCGNFIGEKKPGESRVLRNANRPELVQDFNGITNLRDIFVKNSTQLAKKDFLGTRQKNKKEDGTVELGPYEWINYQNAFQQSEGLANFLIHHNLAPRNEFPDGNLRTVSLYAKNREEWVITDMACILTDITVVTLYDTLGKDSIEYILDQTHIKTIVLSSDKVKVILDLKKNGKIPNVSHIIYMDDLNGADEELAKDLGVTLVNFKEAVKEGLSLTATLEQATGDSIYTICYTSGTTGMPKGVMLSHKNFVSNLGAFEFFDGVFRMLPTDVYISYLPLAHVLERMLMLLCMAMGC